MGQTQWLQLHAFLSARRQRHQPGLAVRAVYEPASI